MDCGREVAECLKLGRQQHLSTPSYSIRPSHAFGPGHASKYLAVPYSIRPSHPFAAGPRASPWPRRTAPPCRPVTAAHSQVLQVAAPHTDAAEKRSRQSESRQSESQHSESQHSESRQSESRPSESRQSASRPSESQLAESRPSDPSTTLGVGEGVSAAPTAGPETPFRVAAFRVA